MPAQTPSAKIQLNFGNRMAVLATFTAIDNGDTWVSGLGKVEAVFIQNSVSGVTTGATYSAGTVTFALSGSLANCKVLAIGNA
jgi:hypothetical protein